MGVDFESRLISILTYITMGLFGVVWLIFANVTKRQITPFLSFNLYQAIFLSVALAAISLLYSIMINFLVVIPFVGGFVKNFNFFFNSNPIYFGFSLSSFLTLILLLYLCILSLLGKRPYLPFISDMINYNFGG